MAASQNSTRRHPTPAIRPLTISTSSSTSIDPMALTPKQSALSRKFFNRHSEKPLPLTAILAICAIFLLLLTFIHSHHSFCSPSTVTHPHFPSAFSFSHSTPPVSQDFSTPSRVIESLEQWSDPAFARSRLRIFVYDIPSRFNTDLVDASHRFRGHIRDPHCDQNFYSSEVHVHRFLLNSSVRVTDPSEANFFYVPIYSTCDLINTPPNDLKRTGRNFRVAMRHVTDDFPYWNQSNGRDHVFLFAQGFSARLSGGDDWTLIKNAIFLVHNGEFTAPEYTPHKDITIPPELRFYFNPIWASEQSVSDFPKKRFLAQFGGQVIRVDVNDHRGSNYSGGVRQFIRNVFTENPDYRITGVRSHSYLDDMMQSKFCLAPEGWHPWSPRPYYAVQMGCVPVIISEVQELAFEEFVDWDSFAVWVKPEDIEDLDDILRKFSKEDLERRREEMRKIWRVFWYEGSEGLGYQAILQSLYNRKMARRPRRTYSTANET